MRTAPTPAPMRTCSARCSRITPSAFRIAGTVESIGEITPQVLQDCHAAFYAPANLMLCVTDDVDPALVEEIARAESANAHAEPVPVRDYGPAEAMTCPTKRTVRHMEIAMPDVLPRLQMRAARPRSGSPCAARSSAIWLPKFSWENPRRLYTRLYDEGLINSELLRRI